MKRIILTIVIAGVLSACSTQGEKKLGYIDLARTFDEFSYKKELENDLVKVKQRRADLMDSLKMDLELLSRNAEKDQNARELFLQKREEFLKKREEMLMADKELMREFDERIIKQLNQYVKDYGVVNHYGIIHGTTGSGEIMYADSTLNITNEVIAFINQKYKGKK